MWKGIGLLRQKTPQLRMVPAQLVTGTVSMRSYAVTKPFDLRYERLSSKIRQVFIHPCLLLLTLYAARLVDAS
jgi:hypothetical protein